MGNLFTSLLNSTGALQVYGRVFNVIENNITNANTPGYVEQDQALISLPFDPEAGLTGGVAPGILLSARSTYLEQAVRNQQQRLGDAQQRAGDLSQLESLFDTTGQSGVSGALNGFFNNFSQLSVNPNDAVSRQGVIAAAGSVAQAFNQNAIDLSRVSNTIDGEIRDSVSRINDLAKQIADINAHNLTNIQARSDAGQDARLNASLEDLSGLVDYSVVRTSDGTFTLYAGGQTPLVVGDHAYPLSTDFSTSKTIIRDSLGNDITGQIEGAGGTLGAALKEKNITIPGYRAALDTVAQSLADTVNTALSQGVDRNGNVPVKNLFSYNPALGSAFTLAVTNITPDEIAAALPGAPGGNGNAILLAQLASQPGVGGFTFTQAYGNLAGLVGRDVATAKQDQTVQQDLVTQAQSQRAAASGVSLDKEATKLLQFQQAYQAVGKMVGVLNSLTDTVINILP